MKRTAYEFNNREIALILHMTPSEVSKLYKSAMSKIIPLLKDTDYE